ncbi:hypothetical protein ACUJ46_09695 [Sandaracinobacteroides sp. A072]|uniref:hypothetical protein n=1 Tax=Sandaracinobacteroides sp. A072 TaxID=3461146 RepID=UPI004040F3C0
MARQARLLWQVVKPGQKPVSEAIAGSVGVAGDLANMVTDSVEAWLLAALFAGGTVVALFFCLRQVAPASAAGPDMDERMKCLPCDIGHFMALSAVVFSLLWMIGGGNSGIEAIGQRLGLIEQRVEIIQQDVGDLRDAANMQIPISRPKTAADHFHNAFLHHQFRNDSKAAWESAQAIYAGAAPRRLDAAQIFYDAGSAAIGQTETLVRMQAIADGLKDPSLLVIMARAEPDGSRKQALVDRLRGEAPDYPFSWWDPMRPETLKSSGFTKTDIRKTAAELDGQIERLRKFRTLYAARPASEWFFRPNFQGNLVDVAGSMETSLTATRRNYDQILSGELERKAREDARRSMAEARAALQG